MTEDSFTYSYQPTARFGTRGELRVGGWWGHTFRSFVYFDLSDIPEGAEIESATLEMYKYSYTYRRTDEAYRVTGPWSESSLSWSTMPQTEIDETARCTVPSRGRWCTWNVTEDVDEMVNGGLNEGWMLRDVNERGPSSCAWVFFRSGNGSSNRPRLVVEYLY